MSHSSIGLSTDIIIEAKSDESDTQFNVMFLEKALHRLLPKSIAESYVLLIQQLPLSVDRQSLTDILWRLIHGVKERLDSTYQDHSELEDYQLSILFAAI